MWICVPSHNLNVQHLLPCDFRQEHIVASQCQIPVWQQRVGEYYPHIHSTMPSRPARRDVCHGGKRPYPRICNARLQKKTPAFASCWDAAPLHGHSEDLVDAVGWGATAHSDSFDKPSEWGKLLVTIDDCLKETNSLPVCMTSGPESTGDLSVQVCKSFKIEPPHDDIFSVATCVDDDLDACSESTQTTSMTISQTTADASRMQLRPPTKPIVNIGNLPPWLRTYYCSKKAEKGTEAHNEPKVELDIQEKQSPAEENNTAETQSKSEPKVKLEVSMAPEQRGNYRPGNYRPQPDIHTKPEEDTETDKREVAATSDAEVEEWEDNLDALLADLDAKLARDEASEKEAVRPQNTCIQNQTPAPKKMFRGQVSWFRGSYGWIWCAEVSKTIFLHKNNINVKPRQNDDVSFDLQDEYGVLKAVNAVVISTP